MELEESNITDTSNLTHTDINKITPTYKITKEHIENTSWNMLYKTEYLIVNYKDPYLYIAFDESDIIKAKPDKQKIEATIDYIDKFYINNKDLVFGKIYNLSNLNCVEIEHMHMFASFLKSIDAKTEKQVYASAIIIKNKIVITLLNTFFTLYKNARPVKIVDNIKDAKLFIKSEAIYYKQHGSLRPM